MAYASHAGVASSRRARREGVQPAAGRERLLGLRARHRRAAARRTRHQRVARRDALRALPVRSAHSLRLFILISHISMLKPRVCERVKLVADSEHRNKRRPRISSSSRCFLLALQAPGARRPAEADPVGATFAAA